MSEEELLQANKDIKEFIISKFGDRFIHPHGGFLIILIKESEGGAIDAQNFTNYNIQQCPHCLEVVNRVLKDGQEFLDGLIIRN